MSQRVVTILIIALMVSAGASFVVYRLVRARISAAAAPPTADIVVAARTLDIGTLIKDSDVKTGEWVGPLPKGAVLRKDDAVGRGVVSSIYEGEPILDTRLAIAGAGAGLAATIPPGMRAVAVRVNEVVGVAGFVVPGMRVDVLITGNPGGSAGGGAKVRTLLQNIEVLSAGQNFQKDAEGKPIQVPVVNLLVTPEQAEILSLASNETRIQLILRNPLDTQAANTPGVGMSNLFNDAKPAAPPRPRGQAKPVATPVVAAPAPISPFLIEVLNGPKRSEVKFARKQEDQQQ